MINIHRKSKGQAMVEAAVVLPIILFILFAFISAGLFVYDNIVMEFASNKGLDTAVGLYSGSDYSNDDRAEIVSAVKNAYNVRIFATEAEVEVPAPQVDTVGKKTTITVKVTSTFNCNVPLIGELFKDKNTLKSQNTFIYKNK